MTPSDVKKLLQAVVVLDKLAAEYRLVRSNNWIGNGGRMSALRVVEEEDIHHAAAQLRLLAKFMVGDQ